LKWSVDEFKKKKIDEIYIEIVVALIKTNKIDETEYTKDILEQLNLEEIKITKKMLDELSKELNSNELNIRKYNILESKDLLNYDKINFYYLLFKYVLNKSYYIFQIDSLISLRKNILKIIRKNNKIDLKEDKRKESEFILDIILDSKFFWNKYKKNEVDIKDKKNIEDQKDIKDNNSNIQKSTNFSKIINKMQGLSTKSCTNNNKEKIETIEDIFKKGILYRSSFLFKNDKSDNNVNFKYELYDYEDNNNQLKGYVVKNLNENFEKFLNFLSDFKNSIEKEFDCSYNLIIKLDFYLENFNYDKDWTYDLTCKYTFYPLNSYQLSSFKDNNILINGIDSPNQGFYYLLDEINNSTYKEISFRQNMDIIRTITIKELYKNGNLEDNKFLTLLDIGNLSDVSEHIIIKFIKVIGKHIDSAEFLLSLSNGFLISGGNCKELIVYNKKYEIKKIIDLSFYPNNIIEINSNNDISNILCSSNDSINMITIKLDRNTEHYETNQISSNNCLEIENNNYIICRNKGVILSNNLFNKMKRRKSETIKNNSYKVVKKINETLIVFTSNEIIYNGKNNLVLYNLELKKCIYELEGFSCSICVNSLLVMNNEESTNKKTFIICACKKYTKKQENGLLLVSIVDNRGQDNSFFPTNSFEPNCLCNILYIKNKEKYYNTNYFIVGGYFQEKGTAGMQLFKLNNNEKEVEFIQDINLEKKEFNAFTGEITCITQSKDTGNLVITCSDGNVYLFSPPNINYYLFCDEQEKKGSNDTEIKYIDYNINKNKILCNQEKLKKLMNNNYLNLFL
jgi:hypothetical protein